MPSLMQTFQKKHAGSWALVAGGVVSALMWYLGDAGVTGMPPQWLIWLVACSAAVALNHLTPDEG